MMYNNVHLYNAITHVDFYTMPSQEVVCALDLFQVTVCDPHFITAQSVLGRAGMEEPYMKKPACVTVQVASVGLTVKVSVLCMSEMILAY